MDISGATVVSVPSSSSYIYREPACPPGILNLGTFIFTPAFFTKPPSGEDIIFTLKVILI